MTQKVASRDTKCICKENKIIKKKKKKKGATCMVPCYPSVNEEVVSAFFTSSKEAKEKQCSWM